MHTTPPRRSPRAALHACALAFAAVSASVQTVRAAGSAPDDLTSLSLEQLSRVQVVYGASRYEQRTADTPASVTIVTAAEIERSGARTIAEVLEQVGGLWATRDHNYTYLGVRGFGEPGDENRRVLVMVNGQRLNEPVFDYVGLGHDFPVPMDAVDRVEVIRGPGSSVYGTNALFAVIHVITREPGDAAHADVRAGAGSEGASLGGFAFLQPLGPHGALAIGGEWTGSRGSDWYFHEYDDGSPGAGRASGLDASRAGKGFARMRWRDLRVQAGWSSARKDVPTAAYGTLFGAGGAQATRTWDERAFLDAQWTARADDRTDLQLRASGNLADYDGQYAYEGANPGDPPSLFHDDARARWFTAGVQITTRRLAHHTIVAGTEWHGDARLDQHAWDETERYTDVSRSGSNWGAYAQDEWLLGARLRLSTGARYDHYRAFGGRLSPRVASVFAPHRSTRLKATYGQAYRAPSSYELDYEGGGNKAAGELDPEIVGTWEAALEQGFGANVTAIALVHRMDVRDLLGQVLDPADSLIVHTNGGRARVEGVGFEVHAAVAGGWDVGAVWSTQRARDRESGDDLANSPRHLGKFSLNTPSWNAWNAMARVRAVSERRTITGGRVAPYALLDVGVRRAFADGRFVLSAHVYNATDAAYADPGAEQHRQDALPQAGRTWRVALTARPGR